jgi:hypothetical protein
MLSYSIDNDEWKFSGPDFTTDPPVEIKEHVKCENQYFVSYTLFKIKTYPTVLSFTLKKTKTMVITESDKVLKADIPHGLKSTTITKDTVCSTIYEYLTIVGGFNTFYVKPNNFSSNLNLVKEYETNEHKRGGYKSYFWTFQQKANRKEKNWIVWDYSINNAHRGSFITFPTFKNFQKEISPRRANEFK